MKKKTVKKTISDSIKIETSEKINSILKIYKNNKLEARKLIEEEARRVWLGYLFQCHHEVTETIEIEETEKKIYNPEIGEITEITKQTKTQTKKHTPRTPYWAIKAALISWDTLSNFEELNAVQLLVESGLMEESALDIIEQKTAGIPQALRDASAAPS